MYKLFISLVLSLILAGLQLYIDKDETDEGGQSNKYPIKPIAIFVSVFAITYMGQTLILNGGINIPTTNAINDGGGSYTQDVVESVDRVAFEKMMQNIQTGEAPF